MFREERRQLALPEAPPFTFQEARDSWQLVVAPAGRRSGEREPPTLRLVLGPFCVVLTRAAAASR